MKPLSKKTRRISWALLFAVFLAVIPFILYYSFGYRFDEKLGFVETGGIYVHADVSNTQVFVDGEYFKNNGILLKNTLIQKLDPSKMHTVDLIKDGYRSWHKELLVVEGLVIEASALMLPIEIEKSPILPFIDTKGVGTTTATIAGKKLSVNEEFADLQVLFDSATTTQNQTSYVATSTKQVPEYFEALGIDNPESLQNLIEKGSEVAWLENGNVAIHWIDDRESVPYYYCRLDKCSIEKTLDWDTDITRFDFFPNRHEILLVLNSSGLWAVEVDDRSERNIQPVYEGAGIDFRVSDNDRIIVLDGGVFFELQI